MIYPATQQYINLAHTAIKNGEVIVYPTDTLYGFGVDATNTEAIQRLNQLKGRVQPLSIVLESVEQMHEYAEFDGEIHNEMPSFFPGQYTALLPAKQNKIIIQPRLIRANIHTQGQLRMKNILQF